MTYYTVFISFIIQWLFIFNIPQYSLVLKHNLPVDPADKAKRLEKLHDLNNALNLNGRHNNPNFRAKIHLGKDSVHLKKGNADSSLIYINIRNQLTDKQALTFKLTKIGKTYIRKNSPDSSKVFQKKSLQISNELKDKLLTSVTCNFLGKYYRSQKNYEAAICYLNKSIEFTKQVDFLHQLEDCYFQLSEIYNELNQSRKALEYLQLRNRIHDSIYSANAQSYITNAQVKYETDRLEKKENISKKLRVNRIITLSVILLLFILTGGTVYYYKNKILPRLKIAGKPSSFKTIEKELFPKYEEKHKKNVDSEILDSISEKFAELLEKEKIFLNEEISQTEIAKRLNTNTTYLSKLINEKYQTNFSSLINRYRVEEAKRLLRENAQNLLTFEGISSESGFHSKSSFNAAFRKFTGSTPTEFARTLSHTNESDN